MAPDTCDRCDGVLQGSSIVLRNAYYDGAVQMLRSRMAVCPGCHEAMQQSDNWGL